MIPSASLQAVSVFAVLASVFAYLYGQQREPRFAIWSLAWLVLFTRQLLTYSQGSSGLAPPWLDVGFVLIASALGFAGSLSIVTADGVARWKRSLAGVGIAAFVALTSLLLTQLFPISSGVIVVAVCVAGATWIAAGWLIDRYGRERTPMAARVAGLTFFLWGFLTPVSWMVAGTGPTPGWWPVAEFGIYVVLAIGMVIVAIQESRLVYSPRRILDEDPNMIIVYNGNGRVFVNRALRNRTGWESRALSATEPLNYVAPEHRERASRVLRNALAGKRTPSGTELEIIAAEGTRIPVMMFADRISWEGARAVKFELIDMTVQRKAEAETRAINRELEATNRQLEKSSRLKSEFLSNTSHELKTPLTSIIANTEILEYEMCGEINDEQRRILTSISRNSQHLLDMISQLLDFARQEEGKAEPSYGEVDLRELIASVVETAQPLESSRRDIVVEVDETLGRCYLDGEKIYRVYLNLVANAIKFSSEGEIIVRAAIDGEEIEGSVQDHGIGIPAEHIDEVFEAFEQVDASATRSYQGVGLGLAISRQLVEMHGGRIWAESVPGQGTTMRFRIPYHASSPEDAGLVAQEAAG